uniref:Uncharacterized protein n=1 Tax=Oryza brachyantha TaxID=4533 RepID=J3N2N3_ORYBR
MVATYISSIGSWEEVITSLGPAKGNASPLVGGTKVGYCSERQTKYCLVYTACFPGTTSMKCPSMSSQAKS